MHENTLTLGDTLSVFFFPFFFNSFKLKPCTHTCTVYYYLVSSSIGDSVLFNALKIVFSLAGVWGGVLPPFTVPLSFLSASHVSHLMQALALTFPFPSAAVCFDWVKSSLSQIFPPHTRAIVPHLDPSTVHARVLSPAGI